MNVPSGGGGGCYPGDWFLLKGHPPPPKPGSDMDRICCGWYASCVFTWEDFLGHYYLPFDVNR